MQSGQLGGSLGTKMLKYVQHDNKTNPFLVQREGQGGAIRMPKLVIYEVEKEVGAETLTLPSPLKGED